MSDLIGKSNQKHTHVCVIIPEPFQNSAVKGWSDANVVVKGKVHVLQWNLPHNGVGHCWVYKMLHKSVHLNREEANAEQVSYYIISTHPALCKTFENQCTSPAMASE